MVAQARFLGVGTINLMARDGTKGNEARYRLEVELIILGDT